MITGKSGRVPFPEDSADIEFGQIEPRSSGALRSQLVIASYNIRYGVGQFLISTGLLRRAGFNLPRRRPEIVRANIQLAANAFTAGLLLPPVDILALQEADRGTARAGGHHVARELAEAMSMSWLHVPAGIPRGQLPKPRQWWLDFEEQIELFDQGDTGVALLSALQLEEVTRIDLPWEECPWRPRLAVGATVQLGSQSLRILNSHIDPHSGPGGQIEQLEAVLQHLRLPDEPAVVLGDFNTLSNRKCIETRRLLESRGLTTPFPTGTATWRGAGIRLHADWIFMRGVKVVRWGVARPLAVSDHWPIWLELGLLS
ncbi:MAG TPA: endonuclease/exonuclease/phosphatase family protein [Pyrinomonadaceae bacterium]|nr:endonuclease/exonuclease/phosphatase family protein [Pyrinomonadaceae bacterium]